MNDILIPFRIAMQHLPRIQTGEIVRYGAILKDTTTGRIVGHVQETRVLQNLLQGVSSVGMISGPGSFIGIVQNAQIQSTLNAMQATLGVLQGLQITNIASSVAGLGVSGAATYQILKRLKSLDGKLTDVTTDIGLLPSTWRELDLSSKMTRVETQLERLEEVPSRKDAAPVVRDCEAALDQGFNDLNSGIVHVVAEAKINADLLRTLLAGMALCSGAQIKALLWLDEKEVAASRARKHTQKMQELAFAMPRDILEDRANLSAEEAGRLSSEASEIRLRTASIPSLVEQLILDDIAGRDYVEQIDSESNTPLLFLPALDRTR